MPPGNHWSLNSLICKYFEYILEKKRKMSVRVWPALVFIRFDEYQLKLAMISCL